MLVLGPILMPLGLLAFSALIASMVIPPFYALNLTFEGRYCSGLLVFTIWLGWLRWGRRLFGWMLQGIQYASL
jgi:hypothetical protein